MRFAGFVWLRLSSLASRRALWWAPELAGEQKAAGKKHHGHLGCNICQHSVINNFLNATKSIQAVNISQS